MLEKIYNGRAFEDHFESLDELLGSASVKVVHKAKRKDGSEVVVKFKRPEVDKQIEQDLAFLEDILKRFAPVLAQEGIPVPAGLLQRLKEILDEELNFGNMEEQGTGEANNQRRMKQNIEPRKTKTRNGVTYEFSVPNSAAVYENSVMVENFAGGVSLKKEAALRELGIDPNVIKELLMEELLQQFFFDGFYHADLHSGNVLIQKVGDTIHIHIIDLGAAAEISASNRETLVGILMALWDKNNWENNKEIIHRLFPQIPTTAGMSEALAEIVQSDRNPIQKLMHLFALLEKNNIEFQDEYRQFYSVIRFLKASEYLFSDAMLEKMKERFLPSNIEDVKAKAAAITTEVKREFSEVQAPTVTTTENKGLSVTITTATMQQTYEALERLKDLPYWPMLATPFPQVEQLADLILGGLRHLIDRGQNFEVNISPEDMPFYEEIKSDVLFLVNLIRQGGIGPIVIMKALAAIKRIAGQRDRILDFILKQNLPMNEIIESVRQVVGAEAADRLKSIFQSRKLAQSESVKNTEDQKGEANRRSEVRTVERKAETREQEAPPLKSEVTRESLSLPWIQRVANAIRAFFRWILERLAAAVHSKGQITLFPPDQVERINTEFNRYVEKQKEMLRPRLEATAELPLSDAIIKATEPGTPADAIIRIKGGISKIDFMANLERLRSLKFEVALLRIRGTSDWILIKGGEGEVAARQVLRIEDYSLFDIFIHNHPGRDQAVPSADDLISDFNWTIGRTTLSLIIAKQDIASFSGQNLKTPKALRGNTKTYQIIPSQISFDATQAGEAGYKRSLKNWGGEFRSVEARAIDFKPIKFNLAELLQSSEPMTRARAVEMLSRMPPELMDIWGAFANDPDEEIQRMVLADAVLTYLGPEGERFEKFKKVIEAFSKSKFPKIRSLAQDYADYFLPNAKELFEERAREDVSPAALQEARRPFLNLLANEVLRQLVKDGLYSGRTVESILDRDSLESEVGKQLQRILGANEETLNSFEDQYGFERYGLRPRLTEPQKYGPSYVNMISNYFLLFHKDFIAEEINRNRGEKSEQIDTKIEISRSADHLFIIPLKKEKFHAAILELKRMQERLVAATLLKDKNVDAFERRSVQLAIILLEKESQSAAENILKMLQRRWVGYPQGKSEIESILAHLVASRSEVRSVEIGSDDRPIESLKQFADALLNKGVITQTEYDQRKILQAAQQKTIMVYFKEGSETLTVAQAYQKLKEQFQGKESTTQDPISKGIKIIRRTSSEKPQDSGIKIIRRRPSEEFPSTGTIKIIRRGNQTSPTTQSATPPLKQPLRRIKFRTKSPEEQRKEREEIDRQLNEKEATVRERHKILEGIKGPEKQIEKWLEVNGSEREWGFYLVRNNRTGEFRTIFDVLGIGTGKGTGPYGLGVMAFDPILSRPMAERLLDRDEEIIREGHTHPYRDGGIIASDGDFGHSIVSTMGIEKSGLIIYMPGARRPFIQLIAVPRQSWNEISDMMQSGWEEFNHWYNRSGYRDEGFGDYRHFIRLFNGNNFRSEVRQITLGNKNDSIETLLPSAPQIVAQIQEKGSLETAIDSWEQGAKKQLEDNMRVQLVNNLDQIITGEANKFPAIEDFINSIFSPEFEKEILNPLQSLVTDGTLDPVDVQAITWRIRGAVTGEVVSAVAQIDFGLAEAVKGIDNAKMVAFENRLDQAITALKETYGTQKLTLAIDYPEDEIIKNVLSKFSDLIDRLEILLEKTQRVKRADWKEFMLSTQIIDPQNPKRAVDNVNRRGYGEEPAFALTANSLPSDLLHNLNAIRADIRKLPNRKLQEMAYTASVLLLFRLAELPKARRSELRKAEAFKSFLEQDENLRFLTNGFGIGQDGTVGLVATGFLSDIAAVQQTKRAA